MAKDAIGFSAAQSTEAEGAPGAVASFPYDRMTVERFRQAFPRARWREDLGAWFVPGTTAERRLNLWHGREWTVVLDFADDRGRDAFAFEPIASPYLDAGEDLVVRTPYAREAVEELRAVPWARWDPAAKAWRVPFRSLEDLRKRWPAIEAAARNAEPEERQKRRAARRASPEHAEEVAAGGERGRRRYPVPNATPPLLGRVLMTHAGTVVFMAVTGELADPEITARFYPEVDGEAGLIWADWRRPTHAELVETWPARAEPGPADGKRGWWPPTLAVLRTERKRAAALDRARAARSGSEPPPG